MQHPWRWTLKTIPTAGLLAGSLLGIFICGGAVVYVVVTPASIFQVENDRPWVIVRLCLHLLNIAQACLPIAGYVRVSFQRPRPLQLHMYMLVVVMVLPGQSLNAMEVVLAIHRMYEKAWLLKSLKYLNWGIRKTLFYFLVKRKLEVFVSSRACCQNVHRWVNVMIVATVVAVLAGVGVWTVGIAIRLAGNDSLEKPGSVAFRRSGEFPAVQVASMRLLFLAVAMGMLFYLVAGLVVLLMAGYLLQTTMKRLAGRGVTATMLSEVKHTLKLHLLGMVASIGIGELLFRDDPEAGDFNLRIRSLLRSTVLTSRAETVFEGSVLQTPTNMCVVSFPGKFMEEWNELTWLCEQREVSSACVFLPTSDPGHRFGQHVQCPEDSSKQCWCYQLYGQEQPWGCLWFEIWRENVERAVDLGLDLVVVFFPGQVGKGIVDWEFLPTTDLWDGVGLGGSQKAEVAFLQRRGLEIMELDLESARKLCLGRSRDRITPPRPR